jgi:MFS family permease
MAAAQSIAPLLALSLLGGIPAGVQRPVARSLQQRLTPNRLLGRVNVAVRIFTRGVIVIGALASGVLAEAVGVRWSFVAGGVIQVLAAAAMWQALRSPASPDTE